MTMYGKPTGRETSVGAKLFADNCAVCHGDAGAGGIARRSAAAWPRAYISYGD